jgi:hypothetical protein
MPGILRSGQTGRGAPGNRLVRQTPIGRKLLRRWVIRSVPAITDNTYYSK